MSKVPYRVLIPIRIVKNKDCGFRWLTIMICVDWLHVICYDIVEDVQCFDVAAVIDWLYVWLLCRRYHLIEGCQHKQYGLYFSARGDTSSSKIFPRHETRTWWCFRRPLPRVLTKARRCFFQMRGLRSSKPVVYLWPLTILHITNTNWTQ